MPSLCSIPGCESGETAKAKESVENDVAFEETKTGESNNKDAIPTSANHPLSDHIASVDGEGPEDTGITTPESEPASNHKKRRVTPGSDCGSKQKQQRKINQMTLSSFFNKGSIPTPSKKKKKAATASTNQENNGVASGSSPKEREASANSSSPSTKLAKETKMEIEIITVDSDDDKVQGKSPASNPISPSKKAPLAVEGTSLSSDNEKTGTASQRAPVNDKKANKGDKSSSQIMVGGSPRSKTVICKPSSPTNSLSVLESASGTPAAISAIPIKRKSNRKVKTKTKSPDPSTCPSLAVVKKKLSEKDLTKERLALLRKYTSMKEMYLKRANEIVGQHRDGLKGEKIESVNLEPITDGTELQTKESKLCEDFPTQVVANMALIIEGSDLPLSRLVSKVCSELKDVHGVEWLEESVTAKVKLLSKRKAYLDPMKRCTKAVDLFEDDDQDRLWRWEVMTLDLLPSDFTSKVRKVRTARKKVSTHHSALLKLVKSLEETKKLILDPELPKLESAKAKISRDEEKVLKFERDAEKVRLADEAKARKLLEQEAKKRAKEEALEAKKRAKEQALEEKKRKKEEAAKAREEDKRKKEEEKLLKEKEKKLEETKKLQTVTKQKASFRSFFAAAPKKVTNDQHKKALNTCIDLTCDSFDADSFRAKLDASDDALPFALKENKRSATAMASRKRRTKPVAVSVYKTVEADKTEWGASDYLEQTTIEVPNRYRFLSFHEDCRPPYRGSWSKKSSIVTGKTPFRKDVAIFDYEYDSEAEWEEGDDELGENVDDDSKNGEDEADLEGNAKVYDFEDGFCVADDRLLDNEEDADEETKALYKKKMQDRAHEEQQQLHSNRIRIIAPCFGGIPLHLKKEDCTSSDCLEGFQIDKATDTLSSYKGIQLSNVMLCVDAFPQLYTNQENRPESNTNGDTNKDDYSNEAMIAMVRFTHHSTLTSKDKVIEELRASSPTLFSNRAKATRKLDAIAVKKKHPKYSGVYWEVKPQILTELNLTDILKKKVEDIVYEDDVQEKPVGSSGDQKSKKVSKAKSQSPDASKTIKAKDGKAEASGSASKKRKTKEKTQEQTNAAKKKKESTSEGRGSMKGDSTKNKDACEGMKNLMAQFVKRSPLKTKPSKTIASSTKDATPSSSSQ
ncbi:unnamed protein product [Pseudo-nitzschia multistriata]|uniref:Chromatin assembly factor 1 subunit A dimerization domain-containing protein n=1 Tax=Pseudo-nitzschia multistriata TaxID=183589 RepID=A0A448YUS3_9STRA|nr:unnamed protein product [Pseudo-nitzschia multistriata]